MPPSQSIYGTTVTGHVVRFDAKKRTPLPGQLLAGEPPVAYAEADLRQMATAWGHQRDQRRPASAAWSGGLPGSNGLQENDNGTIRIKRPESDIKACAAPRAKTGSRPPSRNPRTCRSRTSSSRRRSPSRSLRSTHWHLVFGTSPPRCRPGTRHPRSTAEGGKRLDGPDQSEGPAGARHRPGDGHAHGRVINERLINATMRQTKNLVNNSRGRPTREWR